MNKKPEISSIYKQRIAETADTLFREYGIEKTTMDMISKHVGYSKATVYSYFESKDELLFSIVLICMRTIKEDISIIVAKNCGTSIKFLEICNVYAAFQKANPIYFEAMIGHINIDVSNATTPVVYKDIYEVGLNTNELIREVIVEGIKKGSIEKDINVNSVLLYSWGCISGLIRMASQKEDYIKMNGESQGQFLQSSFMYLINGILKR